VTIDSPGRETRIPNKETDSAPDDFREGPAAAIRAAIQTAPSVNIVLNGAQIALAARADKFTQEVGVRAVENASLRQASAVDVPDVDKAANDLYPARTVITNPWSWGVLGIVAGAVLSFIITILAPTLHGSSLAIALTIAVVVLVVCVAWGIRLILPKKTK
jgi:hypothetical protein